METRFARKQKKGTEKMFAKKIIKEAKSEIVVEEVQLLANSPHCTVKIKDTTKNRRKKGFLLYSMAKVIKSAQRCIEIK